MQRENRGNVNHEKHERHEKIQDTKENKNGVSECFAFRAKHSLTCIFTCSISVLLSCLFVPFVVKTVFLCVPANSQVSPATAGCPLW